GTWDLSELANHTFTKEELAKNWTFSDDYDETKFTADEGSFKVTDAKGNDITSLFDAKWDAKSGKVVVTPKNVETFLNTFKGQKLDVEFAGKVNKDAKGVLENTMVQTNGDIEYKTNTVENPIKVPVTNWVDENGKHLKDQEEGSFPDRDGNDIPGYQLVKIDEDEDGNVT
ncbi:SspB-related isopeptide-forming adhesin, partial [Ligilactobacillus equi]|uniref:SspB-related isopeptide-forming adhesin n=1 Tax=Ligilactobacillus equi TaxID=137357 RepID=UPI00055661CB